MKTKILYIIILLFCLSAINAPLWATDINQTSGTISLSESDYVDDLDLEWNINTSTSKAIKITYDVDTEEDCDYVYIYDVDDNGTATLLAEISGTETGTIYTTSKSGKAKIVFTSDGSCCYADDGYTGFDIEFSEDDRTEISYLNVTEDAYIDGNSYIAGKLGLGTTTPKAELDTRGNAYISGSIGLGTTPSSAYKLYIYNSSGPIGLRSYTKESTTSSIYGTQSYGYNYSSGTTYGIYSYGYNSNSGTSYGLYSSAYSSSGSTYGLYSTVSGGSSSNKWAGYFNGGTVAVYGGKLHLTGSASTVNTTDAGMITFWDDARTTVTDSIISNLRTSYYDMTNYGMAAVPVTGGGELWLSGYSGLRMFTGGNATPRLSITNDGNVGIGTISPQGKFHVYGDDAYLWGLNLGYGTNIAKISTDDTTKAISFQIAGTEYVRLSSAGNVGIGTTAPDQKLTVNGKIHAQEVIIDLDVPVADYVFSEDYNLMPLPEVEKYVKKNSHLPEIPSAAEVKEKGLSMGEMQNQLLKKVEELTLYVIQQDKKIQIQNEMINSMKEKLEKLGSEK